MFSLFLLFSPLVLATSDELKCQACQSTAHLLVKERKLASAAAPEKSKLAIVEELFKEKKTQVCTKEKLQSYAKHVSKSVNKFVKQCANLIPDNPNYKSAQTLKELAINGKRSEVAQSLCIDSGICKELWGKEEEPWQHFGKKEL
eukprot:GEMP01023068.1.p1 GENE.GEMP01023068.1~~GEMP01023068.1.p1  ORF type:complete len:145 (+),score=28.08 GEMP01023068.1:79-513(+)